MSTGGSLLAISDLYVGYPQNRAHVANLDAEIRKVICSTNAIESVNARIRRAVRARGHSQRAGRPQMRHMAVMSLDHRHRRPRWITRWEAALNAFNITFDGCLSVPRR